MRRLQATPAILGMLLVATPSLHAEDDRSKADEGLSTTPAVACRSIAGYEDYEVLPDASLTADEKLLVYYRPLNYRVEKREDIYHIHLTQDGQIRRRGDKTVLLRKQKLLDYEFKMKSAPNPVYLRNTVALKGLKPGDYEYDIILHDKLGQGEPVTRTLAFKVVAAALPKAEADPETTEDRPAPAPKARPKGKRGKASPARGLRP